MAISEWKIDKSGFKRGEWDNEPDRVEWKTTGGLPGLIVRNRMGNLCGYVAVPPGHALHGKHYEDTGRHIDVHGSLTYAEACAGPICHVPAHGEPDDVWWFGFDCAHSFDYIPSFDRDDVDRGYDPNEYRNVEYVKAECEKLARQLAGAA